MFGKYEWVYKNQSETANERANLIMSTLLYVDAILVYCIFMSSWYTVVMNIIRDIIFPEKLRRLWSFM